MKTDWEKLLEYDRLDQWTVTYDKEPLPEYLPLYTKHCSIDWKEQEDYEWHKGEQVKNWEWSRSNEADKGYEMNLSIRMELFVTFSDNKGFPKFDFVPCYIRQGADRISLRPAEVEWLCMVMDGLKQKMVEVFRENSKFLENYQEPKVKHRCSPNQYTKYVEDPDYYKWQFVSFPWQVTKGEPELEIEVGKEFLQILLNASMQERKPGQHIFQIKTMMDHFFSV